MGRRFVVSDIHGCVRTLQKLLYKIGLQRRDTLFVLGDAIDRGPDSCGVLDTLMILQEKGYDLRMLRGNHEDMLMRTITDNHDEYSWIWMRGWGEITLRSFGVKAPGDIPERYVRFMEGLPTILGTDDCVFVHASLVAGENPVADSPPAAMLWGEHWFGKEGLPCGRRLVSGHRIVPLDFINSILGSHHWLIDNGCCTGNSSEYGHLIAIDLDSGEVVAEPLADEVASPW